MEQTQARSNIYALLSRILLQELDDELLTLIKNDDQILEFFPNFKKWDALKTLDNTQLIGEHLNPDFVNISLLHLIPYETFYTRDDQKVETGGANPVTDIYSEFDFIVDYEAARVVSSDHIGVELEFMHHLCEAQIKAMNNNDAENVMQFLQAEQEFLNKHLLQWAPLYLINAKFESRTPLYFDTCEMAMEFLLSDNEFLSEAVAQA